MFVDYLKISLSLKSYLSKNRYIIKKAKKSASRGRNAGEP